MSRSGHPPRHITYDHPRRAGMCSRGRVGQGRPAAPADPTGEQAVTQVVQEPRRRRTRLRTPQERMGAPTPPNPRARSRTPSRRPDDSRSTRLRSRRRASRTTRRVGAALLAYSGASHGDGPCAQRANATPDRPDVDSPADARPIHGRSTLALVTRRHRERGHPAFRQSFRQTLLGDHPPRTGWVPRSRPCRSPTSPYGWAAVRGG